MMKWIYFILAYSAFCSSSGCEDAPQAASPNVILIIADDQGWGDLSMNGNTDIATPHIDGLAEDGASFKYFFVQPVCSPTRAEVLTGRYHHRSGVRSTSAGGERIALDERILAEDFLAAGYRTGYFGKWHSGSQHPYHPNSRGFEEYYGFTSGHWGHYYSPKIDHNGVMTRGEGYLPDDLTNHAMDFAVHSDGPFFIQLAYNTPHSPMQVPDRWWSKFEHTMINGVPVDSLSQDHARAALAMVENIDWNVGRLLAKLEEQNLSDNTIVLYMTDNGPNGVRWNGGMKGRKGSTDEGGVRSPLLIKWPRSIRSGYEITHIAAAIDLAPTLLDLCGIRPSHSDYDGISLKPLLVSKSMNWPDRTLLLSWRGRISIRSSQYRLDHEGQLYDMIADPTQSNPLTNPPEALIESLQSQQSLWQTEINEALDVPDDRPFPIGHPSGRSDYLPARDGIAHGGIVRSNRWPNDSYFTHWTNPNDSITWDIDVIEDGLYNFTIHYTCPADQIGSTIQLNIGNQKFIKEITIPHDPPIVGAAEDRYPRGESYVKDFKELEIGSLKLERGQYDLSLKVLDIAHNNVGDVSRITVYSSSR